jgi:hypothetical protein
MVRDHHHFRRASGHIERRAGCIGRNELLCGGYPGIAWTEYFDNFWYWGNAVGHRSDRLYAAQFENGRGAG